MIDLRAIAGRVGSSTRYQRHGWLLVCALPVVVALAVRGPMPIDETRYLSVAWEMWSQGEFVLPALNGEPYTHKPPLLFWLMHLGWALFGVNAWWPRCIPPLAAIGSVWLLRRLASRLYPDPGSRVPDTVAWLLAGTLAWTAFSTVLLFDLVVVACVVAAICAIERVERAPLTSWCVYAAVLAAGLLTKGPAMFIFALAPALAGPWWSAAAARQPGRWYGGLVAALLAALALAGSWVLSAYQEAGTAFIHTILWAQSATRIVHSVAHARPWWAYLLIFPVLLFPWSLWPTAWRGLRASGDPRAERLAAASLVPAFIAFSLISGKQPHYLLPLVPMAVLWLAPRVARADVVSSAAAPGLVLIAVGAAIAATAPWFDLARVGVATGAALAAGGLLFLRPAADRYAVVRRMAFANAIAIGLLTVAFFSTMGETYQLDRSVAVVRELEDRGVPIAWIGHYDGQFNFLARLDQPLAVFDPRATAQIDEWVAAHPEGRLMTYSRGARKSDLGPEFHQQRYRSGWLAVIPASEAHLAARMALRGGPDEDSLGN